MTRFRHHLSPQMHSRRESGFTLPEMAIVVAILIILAAIAIPALVLYQQTNAKNSVIAEVRASQAKIAAALFSQPQADPILVYTAGNTVVAPTGGVAVLVPSTDSSNSIKVTAAVNNGSSAATATGTGSWTGYEITGTTTQVSGWYYTYNSTTGKYYTNATNNAAQNPQPTSLPVFTTTSINNANVGVAYSQQVNASGNPAPTFTATGLPVGLSISTTGLITGTPNTQGVYTVVVSATNTLGTVTKSYSMSVQQVPVITTNSISGGAQGATYSQQITATGTPTPNFTATGLPPGLAIDSGTGLISGTIGTGASGVYTVTVNATNTSGTGSKSFALSVTAPPKITTTNLPPATQGTSYSTSITATGYLAPTFSATGVPGGLTLNSDTGTLAGTPTASGQYTITITATNPVGTDTKTLTLTINQAPTIYTVNLNTAQVGNAYSSQVSAYGYPAPTFTATGLPTGLGIASNGLISGTPAANTGGSYSVTVTATNAYGTNNKTYALTVNQVPNMTTGSNLPDGAIYIDYGLTIAATGYPAPTYAVTGGSLPNGFSLNSSTGYLSGNTALPTSYSFTITASNSVGSSNQTYNAAMYKTLPVVNANAESTDTTSWGVYYNPSRGFATNDKHSGSQSWKITTTGNNLEGMINCTQKGGPWAAGTLVKASMWVLGYAGEQWVVGGRTDYTEGQGGYLYTTTGSGNWQQLTVSYNLTQSTNSICIQMRQASVSANKWLHADDLDIKVASQPRAVSMSNQGVENGNTNGGDHVVGWGTYWSPSYAGAVTEDKHSGNWSYKIITSGNHNDGMIIGPNLTYGQGQTIQATMWVKGPAGQSWFVSGRHGNPYNEGMGGNYITTTGAWQQVTATWTLDNDIDTAYIQIWQNGGGAGKTLYADDLVLNVY